MAPDSIYYDLYNRIVAAYQQWCMDELNHSEFLVDLNKIEFKVNEAAKSIVEVLRADFSETNEKGEKKDGSKIIKQ